MSAREAALAGALSALCRPGFAEVHHLEDARALRGQRGVVFPVHMLGDEERAHALALLEAAAPRLHEAARLGAVVDPGPASREAWMRDPVRWLEARPLVRALRRAQAGPGQPAAA